MDVLLRQQKRGLCLEFAKLIHDPDFHDLQEKLTITKQPQFIPEDQKLHFDQNNQK
jgi:hypothetical protein